VHRVPIYPIETKRSTNEDNLNSGGPLLISQHCYKDVQFKDPYGSPVCIWRMYLCDSQSASA